MGTLGKVAEHLQFAPASLGEVTGSSGELCDGSMGLEIVAHPRAVCTHTMQVASIQVLLN